MREYLTALKHCYENGIDVTSRAGKVRKSFGYQMRFNLLDGFPAVTTKQLAWRAVVSELLWFLEGSSDERRLAEILYEKDRKEIENKKTIWTQNSTSDYWMPKAKFKGDVGRIYGVQWSDFGTGKYKIAGVSTLDYLQLYQSGIKNIVAVSGTSLTDKHVIELNRYVKNVKIAYDGDQAGKNSAIKAGYIAMKNGLTAQIVEIPNGLDPDDWVKKDGPKPFLGAVNKGSNLFEFHINNSSEKTSTLGHKALRLEEDLIFEIDSPGTTGVDFPDFRFKKDKLGGLKNKMPITFLTFAIGALSLAGIPPLAGFWSKDEILL